MTDEERLWLIPARLSYVIGRRDGSFEFGRYQNTPPFPRARKGEVKTLEEALEILRVETGDFIVIADKARPAA